MIKKTKKNKKQSGGSGRASSASRTLNNNNNLKLRLDNLKFDMIFPQVPIHTINYEFLMNKDISVNMGLFFKSIPKENKIYKNIIDMIVTILESFKKIKESDYETNIEIIRNYLNDLYLYFSQLKILMLKQYCNTYSKLSLDQSYLKLEKIDRFVLWIKYFHETAQKCLDESDKLIQKQMHGLKKK